MTYIYIYMGATFTDWSHDLDFRIHREISEEIRVAPMITKKSATT